MGVKLGPPAKLQQEHRVMMFEKTVLTRLIGHKAEEVIRMA
jgi:hypothetical protein